MGDTIVLFVLILVICLLILSRWISFSFLTDWLFQRQSDPSSESISGEVPKLLRKNGYEPVEAKKKIPITIDTDEETYESRIYIDYLAQNEDGYYVVITSRERKPLRRTGAAIRDYFFPYYLLYRPQGILYVDRKLKTIEEFTFDLPEPLLPKEKRQFPWPYLISFVMGMILMQILRY